MTAGGRVGEEVYQVHDGGRDVVDCSGVVEHKPRLKHVHRRPTDEELSHHHEQHLHTSQRNGAVTCKHNFFSIKTKTKMSWSWPVGLKK